MRMGSINAIVSSCGTATISLTGRDQQQRRSGPRRRQNGTSSVCPFLILKVGNGGDGNSLRPCCRSHFASQIRKGRRLGANRKGRWSGARTRAWRGRGRSRQTSASWQTDNKHLRLQNRSQAKRSKHENQRRITSTYMRGENSYRKKWHTAINTSAACIVPYITKKEVFTKTNTHCCLSI